MQEAGRKLGTDSGRADPALRLLVLSVLLLPLPVLLAPDGTRPLAGAVFAGAAALAVAGMHRHHDRPRAGPANAITLLRLALTVAVLGHALRPEVAGAGPAILAGLALVMDGLDGPVARHTGLASRFGFWFDMEVDVALTFALALFAVLAGKAGAWVLLLGLAHPVFLLAGLALPWLRAPLADSFRRKAICVAEIAVLVLLTLPGIVPPLSVLLAGTAMALVGWSFAVDVLWLARRR